MLNIGCGNVHFVGMPMVKVLRCCTLSPMMMLSCSRPGASVVGRRKFTAQLSYNSLTLENLLDCGGKLRSKVLQSNILVLLVLSTFMGPPAPIHSVQEGAYH